MLSNAEPEFDSKSFLSNYEDEKRWIRSQLTPLNYLFDKLKAIEEKLNNLQVNNYVIVLIIFSCDRVALIAKT